MRIRIQNEFQAYPRKSEQKICRDTRSRYSILSTIEFLVFLPSYINILTYNNSLIFINLETDF